MSDGPTTDVPLPSGNGETRRDYAIILLAALGICLGAQVTDAVLVSHLTPRAPDLPFPALDLLTKLFDHLRELEVLFTGSLLTLITGRGLATR